MKPESGPRPDAADEEVQLHHRIAGEYERRRATEGSRYFESYWNEEILRAITPYGKESVIDCCCGDGILLPVLLERFARVAGIDISDDMLAMARRRVKSERCTIVQGDIEALPFADAGFDVAVFRGSFHHLAKPRESLREVGRVLRPGGGVVLFEPNGDPFLMRWFRKLYYALSPRFSSTHRSYRRRELFDLIRDAGLQPVTAYTIFFMAYPFAGLLDHFPVFRFIPFHARLTKFLIRVDRVLTHVPLIRRWGLCLVVIAEKPQGDAA
jgi:ubiquinone/menaquinone biosynthesis C-methylase UbiE